MRPVSTFFDIQLSNSRVRLVAATTKKKLYLLTNENDYEKDRLSRKVEACFFFLFYMIHIDFYIDV